MAKSTTVWGIDIGNSSLKALHCREGADSGTIEAIGFDYIEHSKILSQPGSDPAEILRETLTMFLSRNTLKGDKVAISVSGQNTISRFLKLPPVDSKKIPDIIKFEAKQWLPFDLEEVIWSYQPIGSVNVEGGIVLDSEIGMFAMKRDIAAKTLVPYTEAGIDIDCIQSSPLAIYNYVSYDQLRVKENDDETNNRAEATIILSVGTDATDVIITNGVSIWTRSIPIGGNLFTKALTKGLKLTFSKAEYLKRNAATAEDPKAVFQAMKPVFNDMLNEVHRSIEFYSNLHRRAKFSKILAIGNAMKMPGLRQFLAQNLGFEVVKPSGFERLVGDEVLQTPLFKDNIIAFPVAYGLAAQLLGETVLTTNLMPREVVLDRIVREKKPWALAAAAALLLGLTVQFAGASSKLDGISRGEYGAAKQKADSVQSKASGFKTGTSTAVTEFKGVEVVGENLTSNVEGRVVWLELLKAINAALPQYSSESDIQFKETAAYKSIPYEKTKKQEVIYQQNRVYISNIEIQEIDDAATWWTVMKEQEWYTIDPEELEELENATASGSDGTEKSGGSSTTASSGSASTSGAAVNHEKALLDKLPGPPVGVKCKIVQIVGFHYHNSESNKDNYGPLYIRNTLVRNLKFNKLVLPASMKQQLLDSDNAEEVTMQELGIYCPTLLLEQIQPIDFQVVDPAVVRREQEELMKKLIEKQNSNSGTGGIIRSGGSSSVDTSADPYGLKMGLFKSSGGRNSKTQQTIDTVMEGIARKADKDNEVLDLRRYDFVVQFVWVETPPNVREQKRLEAALAAAQAELDEDEDNNTTDTRSVVSETPINESSEDVIEEPVAIQGQDAPEEHDPSVDDAEE